MKKGYLLALLVFLCANVFGQYCNPPFYADVAGPITNVSIGTLNNTSGATGGVGWAHYYDSMMPIVLYRDSTYIMSVTFDTVYPSSGVDNSWYCIGIPFDSSANFYQFITPIRFFRSGAVGTTFSRVTDTFHVTVPHSAINGITRLRIVRWGRGFSSSSISPRLCTDAAPTFGHIGEAEEYNLLIQDAPPVDTSQTTDTTHVDTTTNNTLSVRNLGSDFWIYPNPAKDVIHFSYTKSDVVVIRDLQGRTQYESSDFAGNSIPVKSLPTGLYLIYINNRNYIFQKD